TVSNAESFAKIVGLAMREVPIRTWYNELVPRLRNSIGWKFGPYGGPMTALKPLVARIYRERLIAIKASGNLYAPRTSPGPPLGARLKFNLDKSWGQRQPLYWPGSSSTEELRLRVAARCRPKRDPSKV